MGSNWTMPGEFDRPRYFGNKIGSPPPNPPPPTTTDSDVQAAAAAARAAQRKRRGRQSTILSDETTADLQTPSTGKAKIGD